MSKRWEYFVGQRYVRVKSSNGFLSFISSISMLGIAIGVAVLIVVLSVVNGFERELRTRLLAMSAHATMEGPIGPLRDWRARADAVAAAPGVAAVAPYIAEQGLLVHASAFSGIEVRGIDPVLETGVSGVAGLLTDGDLDSLTGRSYNIVLGVDLAETLGVTVGDKVVLMIADGIVTPAGVVPRSRRFTVSGVYRAGMYEFDRRLALVNMADAERLFRYRGGVTGLRLKVGDLYRAPAIVRAAAVETGGGVLVSDWTRQHTGFFRSIQITKSILFVILSLVVGVAAFNIVSTLVMVVKDKQRDIAILRTAGASPRAIMRVFVWQGAIIGLAGTAAGLALGALLTLNFERIIAGIEVLLDTKLLAADVYFISDLPADLRIADLVTVGLIALLLCLAATLYPSWRAANTAPADALRYD
ncbi:MAG: lipoprotein-releasing ABC transporter permease subunit [Pseudomonadota bacterium]